MVEGSLDIVGFTDHQTNLRPLLSHIFISPLQQKILLFLKIYINKLIENTVTLAINYTESKNLKQSCL